MNVLESFYRDLDQNDWDISQEGEIDRKLQEASQILLDEGLSQHFVEIERQVFHFSKTPQKQLSFRVAGTQKQTDGSEIPFEWPNINTFTPTDFDYLDKRFNNCQNTYAKSEYGLVLFYSKQLKSNQSVASLLNTLFELLKKFVEKGKKEDSNSAYIYYTKNVLANALHIAYNRKGNEEIDTLFKALIQYTFDLHQSMDITAKIGLRANIDLTDFAILYFKDFKQTVEVAKFIEKNWEVAKLLSDTHTHGAIYVSDTTMQLCGKLAIDKRDWLCFKAQQYEKLASQRKGDYVSLTFLEKAMSIYKSLKNEENLSRLKKEYQDLRTALKLGTVQWEAGEEESQRIITIIKKEVREKSEEEIIETLLFTPMIYPLEYIKTLNAESSQDTILLNLIPKHISDSFGNISARYETEEERSKYSLLNTYGLHFQSAIQIIVLYFWEALDAQKISANGLIHFLNNSWMGKEVISRKSNGKEVHFSNIQIVAPGINLLFDELQKENIDTHYPPNFICCTDSLILKVEYLLREFCYFLNIPTFKQKDKHIVMERNLDDILGDETIKNSLTEDDYFFIKYILTEKVGYNLRNRIAHGLMDYTEYGLEHSVMAILIILKLSNYQFLPVKKD